MAEYALFDPLNSLYILSIEKKLREDLKHLDAVTLTPELEARMKSFLEANGVEDDSDSEILPIPLLESNNTLENDQIHLEREARINTFLHEIKETAQTTTTTCTVDSENIRVNPLLIDRSSLISGNNSRDDHLNNSNNHPLNASSRSLKYSSMSYSANLNSTTPSEQTESVASTLKSNIQENTAIVEKCSKMLNMGIPIQAIYQQMKMQGIELNSFLDEIQAEASKIEVAKKAKKMRKVDKKYAPYQKMLRMGLPLAAVAHKVRMDGLDPDEVLPHLESKEGKVPQEAVKKEIKRVVSWTPMTSTAFWTPEEKASKSMPLTQQQWLHTLFIKGVPSSTTSSCKRESGTPTKTKATLMDAKRTQNMSIILARIKGTPVEIKDDLVQLSGTLFNVAQLQSLLELHPSTKEWENIRAYSGDVSLLNKAEAVVWELKDTPRVSSLLRALIFKHEMDSRVQQARLVLGEHCMN